MPTVKHSVLRDFAVLDEVCSDVRVKLLLQPLTDESLRFTTTKELVQVLLLQDSSSEDFLRCRKRIMLI